MADTRADRLGETGIIQLFPFLIGACYVAGLLIVNIELARHGVWNLELGRAQYVFSAVLWFVLTGFGIAWLIFVFMIFRLIGTSRFSLKPFNPRKLISAGLFMVRDLLFIAILQILNFYGLVYAPIFLLSGGPDYISWLLFAYAMNAFLMIIPIVGLSGVAGRELGLPALARFAQLHKDEPFLIAFGSVMLLFALGFYAVGLYPNLTRTFGGGRPPTVRVVLKDPIVAPWPTEIWTSIDAKKLGPVSLLDESGDSIVVTAIEKFDPNVSPNRAPTAIKIVKDKIDLILYNSNERNDNVLILGGYTDNRAQGDFINVYDSFYQNFHSIPLTKADSGTDNRVGHTLTVIDPGKLILIAGGYDSQGLSMATAYTYYKSDKYWAIGKLLRMAMARGDHGATLLASGDVLITGGKKEGEPLDDAELFGWFNELRRFRETGKMVFARYRHAATSLKTDSGPRSSEVLISGGIGRSGFVDTAELYEPSSGAFRVTGRMIIPRADHRAVLLGDGSVLVTGGMGVTGILDTAEIYDPGSGRFSTARSMMTKRQAHSATVLNDGTVLIVGGRGDNGVLSSAEIYDPRIGLFTSAGHMTTPREGHTATLLNDGSVVIAGGKDESGHLLSTAEIFDDWTHVFRIVGRMTEPSYNSQAVLFRP